MSNVMFQYNQESAMQARESFGITESGAYSGKLSAKYVSGSNGSKSAGIEFGLDCPEGKLQFMYVCYQKKNGDVNDSGYNMINAIMGLLKIPSLTSKQDGENWICPEFQDKQIGLVVQKVIYNKNDSAGTESYKFEPVMPFSSVTRKTLKEALSNSPATSVDKMIPLLKTKDERKKGQQQSRPVYNETPMGFDDDIPFN